MTVPRFNPAGRFNPDALFHPASIAVIGAETQTGSEMVANIAMGGFTGDLHTRLVENTALAVLAVPPEQIGDAVTSLAAAHCFAAIVPGPANDLAAHAARTGVRILGPHSFGLARPGLHLNATRSHLVPPLGRVALISQSSGLSRAVIDWAEPNGVGFSHIVGLGANADIGFGMTLDWLSRDPSTSAVLLEIHRIKDHRRFLSAARAAARLRPVVAIHAGPRLLDAGAELDLSFDAALRRAGVLSVTRLEDMLAAAETLRRVRLGGSGPLSGPSGDTLAIVSNAIGPARLAADSVLRQGLRLPPDRTITHVASSDLAATAFALAASRDIGAVLAIHAPEGQRGEAPIAGLSRPPADLRVPLLICAMGETTGAMHRATLAEAGLAVFAIPDQAVRAFTLLVRDRRNREAARELPASAVLPLAPERDHVRRCFGQARQSGRLAFTQDEALDILAAYGILTVPTRFAASASDAIAAARLLGFPVVVKLRDSAAPALRPAAGVVLDLPDAARVHATAELLRTRAQAAGRSGELLVQRHVGRSRELAVRVADDRLFGPMITFGSGGTSSRQADRAADLPPLNVALAKALIDRSPAGASLRRPLRDQPAANADAVAQTLIRISQLIIDFPEVAVLEVPSLFVDAEGVLAADAWLRLRGLDEAAPRLAIAPYPVELVERRRFGSDPMTIRPIRPEDATAHAAFFSRLSPEDIRYRFFSAMRELSPELTARLTQIDYEREMAFIAVNETTNDTVGVARLASDLDGRSGEFAVIVQADMKGRGLASHLMRRLIEWARMHGINEVVGQILSDNQLMLAFVRHLGFAVRRMADDAEVMEARLAI